MITDVFISYSVQDQNIADAICRKLDDNDISFWIATAEGKIRPGEMYPSEIVEGIQNARMVVFIDSKSSAQSPHVLRELERAVHFKKSIIRFSIENYTAEEIGNNKKVIDYFTCVEQHIDASFYWRMFLPVLVTAIVNHAGKMPRFQERQEKLRERVVKYLRKRTFADKSWIEAISSQYFLIESAFRLNLINLPSYDVLEEEFFDNSCKLRKGKFVPTPTKILVVPQENELLVEQMSIEDQQGKPYPDRLRASCLDTQEKKDMLFYNYYYGLMISIINRLCQRSPNNDIYKTIRTATMEELLNPASLDEAGGWIHYRLPWITARILISLSTYSKDDIRQVIKDLHRDNCEALQDVEDYYEFIRNIEDSIIDRLVDDSYWDSGAGNWVSRWESTGLCLEALYANHSVASYSEKIQKVADYLFSDEIVNQWLIKPCFDDAAKSNNSLSSIILSTVLFRLIASNYIDGYKKFAYDILSNLESCMDLLEKTGGLSVQQACTIPQIIYYLLIALEDNIETN